MRISPARASKVFRFIASGITGFLINVVAYWIFVYKMNIWYISASFISFLIALNINFIMQKFFAFRDRSYERISHQHTIYLLIILVNMVLNAAFLYYLVEYISVDKILALIFSNAIIALWTFFLYEQILFPKRSVSFVPNSVKSTNIPLTKVSVVIPCYNEEASIESVIEGLPKGVHEVIVVDNNCTDRTAEIARGLGARVIPEKREGYGAALQAGFSAARGDVIAALDGDNQYPAYEIPRILTFMSEHHIDFISTARFPLKDPRSMSLLRRIGNWGLTFAANCLFDLGLADSQSGMWVFKRNIFDHIRVYHHDMPLSQELKIKAASHGAIRFAEYPIPYHPRTGESKLSPFRHGVILLWNLLVLRIALR